MSTVEQGYEKPSLGGIKLYRPRGLVPRIRPKGEFSTPPLWKPYQFCFRSKPREFLMKPPRAYAPGILHFFGEIRRSTLLRSLRFGGSAPRIHPRTYGRCLLRRRINKYYEMEPVPTFSTVFFSANFLTSAFFASFPSQPNSTLPCIRDPAAASSEFALRSPFIWPDSKSFT